MDVISQAALSHLQSVIAGYLPAISSGSIDRNLLITPTHIKPLGIGGYIGINPDPEAEIYGRFMIVQAEVRISDNDQNLGKINDEVSGVVSNLLATDRVTLREDGIFKLDLDTLSPPDPDRNDRVALFRIHCEYLQIPIETEGKIDEVVIKQILNPANGRTRFLTNIHTASLAGLPDPLIDFLPLTDTDINNTSPNADWVFSGAENRIEQRNAVRGGGLTLAQARKAGAQLLIRPGGNPVPVQHAALSIRLNSASEDGIGCVLRWQDSENYYYFLISQANNYQVFGKKVAGVWSFLESDGQSNLDTIDLSQPQNLLVVVLQNTFRAYLNETLICAGEDTSLTEAGETGLLTHGNNAAFFYEIDLVQLLN